MPLALCVQPIMVKISPQAARPAAAVRLTRKVRRLGEAGHSAARAEACSGGAVFTDDYTARPRCQLSVCSPGREFAELWCCWSRWRRPYVLIDLACL